MHCGVFNRECGRSCFGRARSPYTRPRTPPQAAVAAMDSSDAPDNMERQRSTPVCESPLIPSVVDAIPEADYTTVADNACGGMVPNGKEKIGEPEGRDVPLHNVLKRRSGGGMVPNGKEKKPRLAQRHCVGPPDDEPPGNPPMWIQEKAGGTCRLYKCFSCDREWWSRAPLKNLRCKFCVMAPFCLRCRNGTAGYAPTCNACMEALPGWRWPEVYGLASVPPDAAM